MLDDQNVLKQRDPEDALGKAAAEAEQLRAPLEVQGDISDPSITSVVVAGMGGSALAALLAKDWLDLRLPFEIVRGYTLPAYVSEHTLVVVSSYSGNTEETVAALEDAKSKHACISVIASGGELWKQAKAQNVPRVHLLEGVQPRIAVFANLNALVQLLKAYKIVETDTDHLAGRVALLKTGMASWLPEVETSQNMAKQLALECVGKTPVIYASSLFRSVAYKWKISFNENAKNVAFWNELSEFNHNEFEGWTSHPIEKPFAVIDLRSSLDNDRIKKRFELSDRLLSGLRPKAHVVELQGTTVIEQMLWGSLLADFVTIYVAILNGVDPTKVDLIEKFKKELA